jgi:hypothetical protein
MVGATGEPGRSTGSRGPRPNRATSSLRDRDIATAIGRLDRYLCRIKRALKNRELSVALSDTAELSEIARRLWVRLELKLNPERGIGKERAPTVKE